MPSNKKLIPLAEWAQSLTPPMHPANARKLAQRGDVPATKPARDWLILQDTPDPRPERYQ